MNAAEYKALQINKIIKSTDTYQDYLNLKDSISEKYQIQEDELYQLQQELVNLAYEDEENFNSRKKEYLTKKEAFYKDPLIKRFVKAYQELQDMIGNVQQIIELGV